MQDRVAVVTGANRGIGAEVTRQLRENGIRVITTSREPLDGFATLDVTRADHIDALARRVKADGGLDALVNNAGVSLDGFDADVARRTLAVNLFGAMHVTDALLPSMRPGARIVMVSSGMGELSGVRGRSRAHARRAARPRRVVRPRRGGRYPRPARLAVQRLQRVEDRHERARPGPRAGARRRSTRHPGERREPRVGAHAHGGPLGAEVRRGRRTDRGVAPSGGFFRDEQAIPW